MISSYYLPIVFVLFALSPLIIEVLPCPETNTSIWHTVHPIDRLYNVNKVNWMIFFSFSNFFCILGGRVGGGRMREGLKVNPQSNITFSGDLTKEIRTTFAITNKSDQKIAYKIKCTKNDTFKISSSMDLLPSGQTKTVTILYRPSIEMVDNRHHVGVYSIPAPEGCTAASAWCEHYGPPVGEHRLKINFEDR